MEKAKIAAYDLPDLCRIERASSSKWAVRRWGECLNHDGEFEIEPLPSNREDDFLARCRFDSAEAAYQAWERLTS